MANKTYYSQPKPKKGMGKIIAATACVLALLVGVSAIGVGTSGFKDWSFSKWFPKTEQTGPDLNENGGATITEGEASGMVLAATAIPLAAYEENGVSPLAENAYSLNVAYTPADTTYQATTYTIKFKNPSSDWAKGKTVTDYATIEQSSVGSKDAVLTVLKPFSEQIIVTATNDRNAAIKATTTVDYVGAWNANLCTTVINNIDTDIEVICNGMFNGTLSPEFDECFTLTFNLGSFQTLMNAKGYEIPEAVSYNFPLESVNSSEGITTYKNIILKAGGFDYSTQNTNEAKAYWQDACSVLLASQTPEDIGSSELFSYSIQSERVYNGITYATYVVASDESLELADWSGFEVVATSASTNISSIIAG